MEYVHEVHIFIHFTKFKLEPSIKKVFHKCNSVLLDVKFDRKFSTTEMNMQNLTQTLVSVITRTRDLEEHGNVAFIIIHPN